MVQIILNYLFVRFIHKTAIWNHKFCTTRYVPFVPRFHEKIITKRELHIHGQLDGIVRPLKRQTDRPVPCSVLQPLACSESCSVTFRRESRPFMLVDLCVCVSMTCVMVSAKSKSYHHHHPGLITGLITLLQSSSSSSQSQSAWCRPMSNQTMACQRAFEVQTFSTTC